MSKHTIGRAVEAVADTLYSWGRAVIFVLVPLGFAALLFALAYRAVFR